MPDRASHRKAIEALSQFRQKQAAERDRLTAELAAAEREYRTWVDPKTRFDRARNLLGTFEHNDSVRCADLEAQVSVAADPRIAKAIAALGDEVRLTNNAFTSWGYTNNGDACRARLKAIQSATDELKRLLLVDHDDVAGAIRKILGSIPTLSELELAHHA
jgi:hypothetical protein